VLICACVNDNAHPGLVHEVLKNDENSFELLIKEQVQAWGPAFKESCYRICVYKNIYYKNN